MHTISNFFDNKQVYVDERQSKIIQLRKQVYSKKLKTNKKYKQKFTILNKQTNQNHRNKNSKVIKSKSEFIIYKNQDSVYHHVNNQIYNSTQKDTFKIKSSILNQKDKKLLFNNCIIKQNDQQTNKDDNNGQKNYQIINQSCKKLKQNSTKQNLIQNNKTVYVNQIYKNKQIGKYYQKMMRTNSNFYQTTQSLSNNKIKVTKTKSHTKQKQKQKQKLCQFDFVLKNGNNHHKYHSQQEYIVKNNQYINQKRHISSQHCKKLNLEQSVTNQLTILRKKRRSLNEQFLVINNQRQKQVVLKKQSLIRKNSLFLMNFLRQKKKQSTQKYQQPHINHILNAANQIAIQQNDNLKKMLQTRILNKNNNNMRQSNKTNKEKVIQIFNSIQIDPW